MKAVILSAGRGTRLHPLTHTLPKGLIPIANRPVVSYQLELLHSAGIRQVAVVVNPSERRRFEEGLRPFIPADLTISFLEQAKPAGLADAVLTAQEFVCDSAFVVLLGDNLFTWSLQPFISRFITDRLDALLMAMRVDEPERYGILTLSGSRVVDLQEKPLHPQSDTAIAGIYLFTPKIFEQMRTLSPSARGELELTDAIRGLVNCGSRVEADYVPAWCIDVGTVKSLIDANRTFLAEHTPHGSDGQLRESRVVGPVSIGAGSTVTRSTIYGPTVIGENTHITGASIGPFTAVGNDVQIQGSTVTNSIVMGGSVIHGVSSTISDSIIGYRARIYGRADELTLAHSMVVGDDTRLALHGSQQDRERSTRNG